MHTAKLRKMKEESQDASMSHCVINKTIDSKLGMTTI